MTNNDKKSYFEQFPSFSVLSIDDKPAYQKMIAKYPPVGDVQFASLMTWWSSFSEVRVAELNGNLVVQYWRPGDEQHSGLSLIGTNEVDESVCAIFDYLRQCGEPVRLVNVPEFVVHEIKYPELFSFEEERKYDEYLMTYARFYPSENMSSFRWRRVQRLIKKFGENEIHVKELDLKVDANAELLLLKTRQWWKRNLNDFGVVGLEVMENSIKNAAQIGIKNACLFAGDELLGICLYTLPSDSRYAILLHVKATHKETLGFDLIAYKLSEWFANKGCIYANLTEDWGRRRLRMFLLALGPTAYFRKYAVEPATDM